MSLLIIQLFVTSIFLPHRFCSISIDIKSLPMHIIYYPVSRFKFSTILKCSVRDDKDSALRFL